MAVGLVLPDDLGNFGLAETVRFARLADEAGFHSVWKQEASGSNGLMALAAAARETDDVRLGSGVANVFSRTPTLLGMSAATLDRLSNGRAVLGVGVSSKPVVGTWHGQSFDRPLRRLREAIEVVRDVLDGGTVHYEGEIFEVGPYTMALDAGDVPIYNGAMGPTNRRLTAEFCDGWLPGFVPADRLADLASEMADDAAAADREPPTVAPWVPTAVAEDADHAARRARELVAHEMAMGYNEGMERYGFREEADRAFERFRAGDRAGAAEAIPAEMVDTFAVYGTPETVRARYERLLASGADVVVAMPAFSATGAEVETLIETLASV
ncbi:MAG: LLM class flavin-dependent oxidoreductase [Haloarculaceae archaeon]